MIWRIGRKEVLSNLITLRFSVGTVLFLALVVVFTTVFISDYNQNLEGYNRFVSKNSDELNQLITYQNLKPTVYKPPEVLAVFSKGIEISMGNSAQVSIGEVPIPKSIAVTKNPLLSVFPVLDIVLIFKLVISILALLLAYDTISGEKEDKTLALILSNNVSRHQILFSKFIGGMITIAVPITIGFLMVGLILLVSPMIQLTISDCFRIVLIYIVSLIMVSVLFNLGLLLSSITKQASDTLMFLLFLWVLLVLAIPNLSTHLAAYIHPVESREKIDLQIRETQKELRKKATDSIMSVFAKNPETGYEAQSDAQEPWGYYHEFATKALVKRKQRIYPVTEPLRIEYADRAWQTERRYIESLKRQKKTADILSEFSPISIYETLISRLSRTDVVSFERFYSQCRDYRRHLIDYLYRKKAFSSLRYFTSLKEEHLFDVKDIKKYGELRNQYGRRKVLPLNMEDFQYRFQPESTATVLKRILPDTALLIIIGIMLYMCSYAAFLKYDVR